VDINYFYTFKEVAKWGSYTRTGEELGYAQSSVTTQIKRLEDHYQTKLFERVGQKMRLTSSGEELLFYVNQVVDLLNEAQEKISQEMNKKGTIRIGTVESLATYFLTPYIKVLKEKHPDLKLILESGITPDLKSKTLEGNYDVSILYDRQNHHPDLMTNTLREEKMVLITPPNHPLTQIEQVEIKHLEGETLIMTEQRCPYRVLFEELLREEDVQAQSIITFGSLEAIKQCVADGLGIALLPEIAVKEEIKSGKLSCAAFGHEKLMIYTQVIYQKKKWLTPPIKHFLSLLTKDKLGSIE
jgi:DNA-binding transcriptional LysR family regulator